MPRKVPWLDCRASSFPASRITSPRGATCLREAEFASAKAGRREPILFENERLDINCDVVAEQMRKPAVDAWAWCQVPGAKSRASRPCRRDRDGLARASGAAHRQWANFINGRGRWRGHLFDGRFASVAMDESHLICATRHVALNPVRALLVAHAADWKWSSMAYPGQVV
jgi:putative transposase